jgi:hypothetical protein
MSHKPKMVRPRWRNKIRFFSITLKHRKYRTRCCTDENKLEYSHTGIKPISNSMFLIQMRHEGCSKRIKKLTLSNSESFQYIFNLRDEEKKFIRKSKMVAHTIFLYLSKMTYLSFRSLKKLMLQKHKNFKILRKFEFSL